MIVLFITNFFLIRTVNKFENWSIFDEVKAYEKCANFRATLPMSRPSVVVHIASAAIISKCRVRQQTTAADSVVAIFVLLVFTYRPTYSLKIVKKIYRSCRNNYAVRCVSGWKKVETMPVSLNFPSCLLTMRAATMV